MCGISVILDPTGSREAVRAVTEMNRLVRHRGPDDEGYLLFDIGSGTAVPHGGPDTPPAVCETRTPYTPLGPVNPAMPFDRPHVILGHRRLSIIDLSPAGHQPMSTPDRRFWIVYNGEIYNYRELRAELAENGYNFTSNCDTEVILASFIQWGPECLHHFNGMWAFVILDTREMTLFAARDRFGVKPLYYWRSPEGLLAFASEIKQFTAIPGWNATLNVPRAIDYLRLGRLDHTGETLFSGVMQVRGGHSLLLDLREIPDAISPSCWYSLPAEGDRITDEEPSAVIRAYLRDSISLRLRSDVPVGSCLSGGLDSSAIVCIMHEILEESGSSNTQATFSAVNEDPGIDERGYIAAVVKDRRICPASITPDIGHLKDSLDTLLWHQDEPFGSTSILAQWLVFRLAREHGITVMLDGQGADETFGGYPHYFAAHAAELLRQGSLPSLIREIRSACQVSGFCIPQSSPYLALYSLPSLISGCLARWWLARAEDRGATATWSREPGQTDYPTLLPPPRTVRDLSRNELLFSSLPALLHWEDRNAMAHSIESRVPFLDYRLVEYALVLPAGCKASRGYTKRILRQAVRGIVPDTIRCRTDKVAFATPEHRWLCEDDPQYFRALLRDAIASSGGLLTERALEVCEEMQKGEIAFSWVVWRWICLGLWMRMFKVQVQESSRSP